MEKELRYREGVTSLVKRRILGGVDARLRSLALLQRGRRARKLVDLAIRGIDVERIPPSLNEPHRAILVSNYPSIPQTLRAILKVGCRLPGERFRVKGIGRSEFVTQATWLLRALGVDRLVFPVRKDEAGAYRLHKQVVKDVLAFLDVPGHVLWMSITGTTRGNGLLEGDLRVGAALFSLKKAVPIVPMGVVTKDQDGKSRAVNVRFGEPIEPPETTQMDEFEKSDLLIDLSKFALCQIARLLPPGQRGDFEDFEHKLAETSRRLGLHPL